MFLILVSAFLINTLDAEGGRVEDVLLVSDP